MPLVVTPLESPNLLRVMQEESVDVLRERIGMGEVEANNKAGWLQIMTHGFVGPWCMVLQYDAEVTVCERRGWVHPIPWSRKCHSARWMGKTVSRMGRAVDILDGEVGDLVVFPSATGLPHRGHAARISVKLGGGVYMLIDGNVGSFRRTKGRVREFEESLLRRRPVVIARYW